MNQPSMPLRDVDEPRLSPTGYVARSVFRVLKGQRVQILMRDGVTYDGVVDEPGRIGAWIKIDGDVYLVCYDEVALISKE